MIKVAFSDDNRVCGLGNIELVWPPVEPGERSDLLYLTVSVTFSGNILPGFFGRGETL